MENWRKLKKWHKWTVGIIAFILIGNLLGLIVPKSNNEELKQDESVKTEKIRPVQAQDTVEKAQKEIESIKYENLSPITEAKALELFNLDSETKQYPKGLFKFKDGTQETASFYSFLGGENFSEAIAIFLDGELARVKVWVEDESKVYDALAEWGVSSNVEYSRLNNFVQVYEYAVDDRFSTNNIARLPNEWD